MSCLTIPNNHFDCLEKKKDKLLLTGSHCFKVPGGPIPSKEGKFLSSCSLGCQCLSQAPCFTAGVGAGENAVASPPVHPPYEGPSGRKKQIHLLCTWSFNTYLLYDKKNV